MDVLQNRVDSFTKARRNKLRWPHPRTWKATPLTLADAGFFFDPSTDDPDNVTCFMCDKQVTEWADDDDPFEIHWQKCAQSCPWASLRCGLSRDKDSHNRFVFPDKSRLPTSKAMEKARLQTFTGWKHDKNKKHMATSKKMAHAGFVFTPTEAGDDTGTCLYCNITLGNWDEDDDPMQHHLDRNKPSKPCAFLALAFDSAPPAAKPKTTKRAPKASHTDVVFPTKTYDGSDDEPDVPFPASTAKTPRKAASSSTAKTPRTMTRSLSRVNSKDREAVMQPEETTPPPKKRSRSKSVSRRKAPEVDLEEEEDERAVSPTPARQRRTRTKSTTKPVEDDPARLFDTDTDEQTSRKPSGSKARAEAEPEPTVTRKSSRMKSTAVVEDDEDDTARRKPSRSRQKSKATVDTEEDAEPKRAPSRSHSRTQSRSEAKAKEQDKRPSSRSQNKAAEDDESSDGWLAAPVAPPPASRTRTKSVTRPKGKTPADEPSVISRKERKQLSEDAAEPSGRRAPSRARTTTPAVEPDVEPPPVQKRTRTVSKTSVQEEGRQASRSKAAKAIGDDEIDVFSAQPQPAKSKSKSGSRPPSRAKTPAPPSPVKEDEEDNVEAMEVEMEEYLPPAAPEPVTVKSKSKAPSRPSSRAQVNAPTNEERVKPSRAQVKSPEEVVPKVASRPSSRAKVNPPTTEDEEDAKPKAKPTSKVEKKAQPTEEIPPRPSSRAKSSSMSKPVSEERTSSRPASRAKEYAPSNGRKAEGSRPWKMELDEGHSVVDISDDDDDGPAPKPVVETQIVDEDDVEMAEVEESMREERLAEAMPVTPPRLQATAPVRPEEALFVPPLATDPFVNLESLTEAEQEMTVEEWVRYQMGIEHDRFQRDGERQLLSFERRADEVRRAITTL